MADPRSDSHELHEHVNGLPEVVLSVCVCALVLTTHVVEQLFGGRQGRADTHNQSLVCM